MTHALERLLAEHFAPAVAEQLRTLYRLANNAGADDERHIRRTEGASFNSRCGRLAHILVQQAGNRDPILLGALFLLRPVMAGHVASGFAEHAEELVLASQISTILNATEGEASVPLMIGALVYCLDAVRHAHMEREDPGALLANAERILAASAQGKDDSSIVVLRELLLRALTQQRRLYEAR